MPHALTQGMNTKIESLNKKLAETRSDSAAIEAELQKEWNKVFDESKTIREAVNKLECSQEYQTNEYGEICQYVSFDLGDFGDVREYLRDYLRDAFCVDLDRHGDVLTMSQGDDCLVIQDDSRWARDNGVWQSSKLVIPETEYMDDDGEIDEAKRNVLIESYMERTGYFPGVFRIDQFGNVSHVNTQPDATNGS